MLKKRFVGVVTVRQGWAVQSFGYNRYLPLGKPECVVENLDRWGADEIFIQEIDRSSHQLGPNINLIKQIASRGLSTPLLYAGGITCEADAVAVVRSGVERVCVDSLLHENPNELRNIANALGTQAVLASLPVAKDLNGNVGWYCYRTNSFVDPCQNLRSLIDDNVVSELIVIDKENEGSPNQFDFDLLPFVKDFNIPLILFGGISEPAQLEKAFSNSQVSAAALGNFLNYKEHAVQKYKEQLSSAPIRPPFYHSRSVI